MARKQMYGIVSDTILNVRNNL